MEFLTLDHHSEKVGIHSFGGRDDIFQTLRDHLIKVLRDLVVGVPLPQVTTQATFVVMSLVIILVTFGGDKHCEYGYTAIFICRMIK